MSRAGIPRSPLERPDAPPLDAIPAPVNLEVVGTRQRDDATAHPTSSRWSARSDRDGALVEALRLKEPTAAERLVDTYGDRAYRLAIRMTGVPQDAGEVVQDALLTVVRKIDTFRGDAAFGSWLCRIVVNAAYQKIRSRPDARRRLSLHASPRFRGEWPSDPDRVVDWSPFVDDPARQSEVRIALIAALDELPPAYRAVIALGDIEGLSPSEISAALNLSIPCVKARTHQARLFLRKRLEEVVTWAARGTAGRAPGRRHGVDGDPISTRV